MQLADALGMIHRAAFLVIPVLWMVMTLPVVAIALIDPRRRSFWFTRGLIASRQEGEAILRLERAFSGIIAALCLIWDVVWVLAALYVQDLL